MDIIEGVRKTLRLEPLPRQEKAFLRGPNAREAPRAARDSAVTHSGAPRMYEGAVDNPNLGLAGAEERLFDLQRDLGQLSVARRTVQVTLQLERQRTAAPCVPPLLILGPTPPPQLRVDYLTQREAWETRSPSPQPVVG